MFEDFFAAIGRGVDFLIGQLHCCFFEHQLDMSNRGYCYMCGEKLIPDYPDLDNEE